LLTAGEIKVNETLLSYSELDLIFSKELTGLENGLWRPLNCESTSRVAIIVPYRDRDIHLRLFLNHMHNFLQKQLVDYAIYVIEEVEGISFNRALLMNIGFKESLKDYNWTCFVFHDVDLVPINDQNLYNCPLWPRHMSVAVSTFNYELQYREIFGGVSALSRQHFELINGYSNIYFGWVITSSSFFLIFNLLLFLYLI
jgi:hypothetical protein